MLKEPVMLVFWAVALVFLAVAGWLGWSQHQLNTWARVSGRVVRSQVLPDGQGKYVGEVTVLTADGERKLRTSWSGQLASRVQSTLDETPAGTTLALPQNPADAQDLRWPPQPEDALLPWVVAGGGILFALIPVGVVALSERKDAIKIAGGIFVALGLGMLAGGAWLTYQRLDVLRNWPEIQGQVLSSWEAPRGRNIRGVDAEFAYTVDGSEVRSVLSSRGRASLLEPGSTHLLRYQPGHPKLATFEASWSLGYFWECMVLGLVGASTCGLGLAVRRWL
ncbi:DUF3592 domain-containing protein [bacterium]|nr:DUF3592 domain-containing protein [bacterium]